MSQLNPFLVIATFVFNLALWFGQSSLTLMIGPDPAIQLGALALGLFVWSTVWISAHLPRLTVMIAAQRRVHEDEALRLIDPFMFPALSGLGTFLNAAILYGFFRSEQGSIELILVLGVIAIACIALAHMGGWFLEVIEEPKAKKDAGASSATL